MIRSLYSGISGMAAHQTKLNVIGNNIANVNTYGFKASRVVFSDVLYQNLSTATGATATTGGTNASQLGYGAKVGSIDMLNTISSGATTGRALDVYIAGEGYLAVQPTTGANRFTRVGNLKFDAKGNLTDGSGSKVMGIPIDEITKEPIQDANGTLKMDGLQSIKVEPTDLEKYTGITIGKSGEITGIRAGDPEFTAAPGFAYITATIPATSNYTGKISIETVVGAGTTVAYTANPDPKIAPELTANAVVTVDAAADIIGDITITKSGTAAAPIYTLNYTTKAGKVESVLNTAVPLATPPALAFALPGTGTVAVTDASALSISGTTPYKLGTVTADTMDVTATVYDKGGVAHTFTSLDLPSTTTTLTLGGTPADPLQDITLDFDPTKFFAVGTVSDKTIGKIEPGSDKPVTLGYLAIAKFANTDGLLQDGNGYFMESANSGEAIASKAGTNGTGGTESANLEMSNVDLSQEFTDMIVAQRGFQANSRIITVSDSILEELINLKR